MSEFQNKVVCVTGASGAIGQALCQHFLNLQATIIALDFKQEPLTQFIQSLKTDKIVSAVADITDPAQVKSAIQKAVAQVGAVEILINNAGGSDNLTLKNMSIKGWQQDINLNLSGAFYCVEAVREEMMQRKSGIIINISSVNALMAFGHPAYSAAKAGLISYTKALAMEFGRFGIRANAICPGTVRTPAWEARAKKNPKIFEQLIKWYPLHRFAEPIDIAYACAFLSSSQAQAISGVILPIDSGLTAGNTVFASELTTETF